MNLYLCILLKRFHLTTSASSAYSLRRLFDVVGNSDAGQHLELHSLSYFLMIDFCVISYFGLFRISQLHSNARC